MKNLGRYPLLFLKGVAMGAADVVPGVSGGTIAFISGIYIELIHTIKLFNLRALKILKHQGVVAAWQHINGNFIAVLLAGILTSLFSLAHLMQHLLAEYPLPLWSFFTGLIIGSAIYLLRQHPPRHTIEKLMLVVGLVIAYVISIAPSVVLESTYLTLFFAGTVAFCAMILPGISGSFILVLLGLYPVFLEAIADFQLDILIIFGAGGLVGLMLFSRLLAWLLAYNRGVVVITMCGFLVGSLNVIWPWKLVTESVVSHSGKTIVLASQNILPNQFADLANQDPQAVACLLAWVMGLMLVLGLEYIGGKYQDNVP